MKSGMAIRFAEANVRAMGRTARGVTGVRMDEGDCVVGMAVVPANAEDDLCLMTVCENGYGKRTKLSDYRTQGRGGRGLIDIKTDERNGCVVGVCSVHDRNGLMIITSAGKVIRINTSDVSMVGRNTKGVRLINLDEGEKVLDIAHFESEDEEDEEGENNPEQEA